MADIGPKYKGSMLRPLKALAYLGRDPVTLPMEPRPAAERYRGFHVNDWEKCIGCGTCATICDNAAIRMVAIPDLPEDHAKGIKPRRPAIDYGRCCWCALCVDICPTGSIALSREYVHISTDLDTFLILPDPEGIHKQHFEKGWAKSDDADLLDLERQPMGELPVAERLDNMREIVAGFDAETALVEASRCIQCGMCHEACPTHMHAPEYIRALWLGDEEEAVRQIYRTNPLPHICGRVCTHRCEDACSIGRRGDPVAIRWLKRYAMDAIPHERVREIAARARQSQKSGKRVAMIGAGPAALTAAYDLALAGHEVTIFEGMPEPGGTMRYGIPEYRLPRERLMDDVNVIASVGVEIRCNTWIGEHATGEGPALTMADLERDYDVVLVGIGLQLGRSTRIPGSEHEHVIRAMDLLRRAWNGDELAVPRSAVVIGGGNVAMDAARLLARLQKQTFDAVNVTVTALEREEQFLADADEIREAREEGVEILAARGPKQCVIEGGKVKCLETVMCVTTHDADGRFHPLYDETDLRTHEAELIVEAIGQTADTAFLGEALVERLEWERGRLKVDASGRTSEAWLWAAGDMVEGPDVVHAIAGGHRAAAAIHEFLAGGRS